MHACMLSTPLKIDRSFVNEVTRHILPTAWDVAHSPARHRHTAVKGAQWLNPHWKA